MNTFQKEYNLLKKYSIKENINIESFLQKAWYYFSCLGLDIKNLNINKSKEIRFYIAPVLRIHNSNLVHCSVENRSEIYLDNNFFKNNTSRVTYCQLAHEIMHALSTYKKDNINYIFGHKSHEKDIYTGINEATTQLFAEEITGIRLTKEENYLYLITNIMRVMTVLHSKTIIASQYINNTTNFENQFNRLNNNQFNNFVKLMSIVYNLSKDNKYNQVNQRTLTYYEDKLILFTKNIISESKRIKLFPQLIDEIINEVQDEEIINKLGINNSQNKKRTKKNK